MNRNEMERAARFFECSGNGKLFLMHTILGCYSLRRYCSGQWILLLRRKKVEYNHFALLLAEPGYWSNQSKSLVTAYIKCWESDLPANYKWLLADVERSNTAIGTALKISISPTCLYYIPHSLKDVIPKVWNFEVIYN